MDKKEQATRYRLMKQYGITLEERDEMILNQEGKCWICEKIPKSRLNIDHRHVKGFKEFEAKDKKKEVRAMLCFMCNTMLHGIEKRLNARFLLERVVLYFSKYKIKGDQ